MSNSFRQYPKNMNELKQLTEREEEIMSYFWDRGTLSVREIVELHDEPRPSRTTVATFVKFLEQKGYLYHRIENGGFIYIPKIERNDYCGHNLHSVIKRYFDNSIKNVVSFLINNDNCSDEEVKDLIMQIYNRKNK